MQTEQVKMDIAPFLKLPKIAIPLFAVSIFLSYLDVFYLNPFLVGASKIIFYLLLMVPLIYLIVKQKIQNRYTKFFVIPIIILIFDMFYYNNEFVLYILPTVVFWFIVILYITSMHRNRYLFETLIPSFYIPLYFLSYLKEFFSGFIILNHNRTLYIRLGTAVVVTIPFLVLFTYFFMLADENFSKFIRDIFSFTQGFSFFPIFSIPFFTLFYLIVFIVSFSNSTKKKKDSKKIPRVDLLISGIFLTTINVLFLIFLFFQLQYLFGGESYIQNSGIGYSEFARKGFFELVWTISIVVLILSYFYRKLQDEKLMKFLMLSLLVQTFVLGISALKKMYLYQDILGFTVLRCYVEWFTYFLLLMMLVFALFLILKKEFIHFLNFQTILSIGALLIVSSINIDHLVANNTIKKFKNDKMKIDKIYLSSLSIDAASILQQENIKIRAQKRDCNSFTEYHFGYCSKEEQYINQKLIFKDK